MKRFHPPVLSIFARLRPFTWQCNARDLNSISRFVLLWFLAPRKWYAPMLVDEHFSPHPQLRSVWAPGVGVIAIIIRIQHDKAHTLSIKYTCMR